MQYKYEVIQGFDPHSAVACVVQLGEVLDEEKKLGLQEVSDGFFAKHAGGACRPRLILKFEDDKKTTKVTFWQRSDTNSPSRSCFDQLLQKMGLQEAKGGDPQPGAPAAAEESPTIIHITA